MSVEIKDNELQPETQGEIQTHDIRVKVYTIDREEREIKLGRVTNDQFTSVLNTLRVAFETVRANKSCMLVDHNDIVHIFNADNVTCIQVERRD